MTDKPLDDLHIITCIDEQMRRICTFLIRDKDSDWRWVYRTIEWNMNEGKPIHRVENLTQRDAINQHWISVNKYEALALV